MGKVARWLRNGWSWFVHSGLVHVLAAVSAAFIIFEVVRGNFLSETVPPLPILYDLPLAYLTGWIFHLLVVTLPERRKRRDIVETVSSALIDMSCVGQMLIGSLTYLGLCPERPVSRDHVTKVCTANNRNDATEEAIKDVLVVARESFARVEPLLTQLPPEIAKLAHSIEGVAEGFGAPRTRSTDPNRRHAHPVEMRQLSPLFTFTMGEPILSRLTYYAATDSVMNLYDECSALRNLVNHYVPSVRDVDRFDHPLSEPWVNHKLNDPQWPVDHYPAVALSRDWPADAPRPSPGGELRLATPNQESAEGSRDSADEPR